MPSKQELMEKMDNRLPGETLEISEDAGQPPAYPDLQNISQATQLQQQQQEQHLNQLPEQSQIYTIQQPVPNIASQQFGSRSYLAFCPSCHATQMTRCDYTSSMMTHIIATILCFTTCCCCVPYCIDNCKSARHYCPNCGSYLGAHNK